MKLMVLDGNSIVNRAYYGIRPLTTRQGLYTNAIYGFITTLQRLLDEEKITEEIASFLYMGIVHDTGVFQYSCTSPETMEVGAALLRKGINGSAIIDGTYFEKSYVQNQMLGKALLESMMILNKKAVVSVIRWSSSRQNRLTWMELSAYCVRQEVWRLQSFFTSSNRRHLK